MPYVCPEAQAPASEPGRVQGHVKVREGLLREEGQLFDHALEHKYIAQFHDPTVERVANRPVNPPYSDDTKHSTDFYRKHLYSLSRSRGDRSDGGLDSRRGRSPHSERQQ